MHEREKWIARWREQNALSAQQAPTALKLAGIPPSRQEWRLWIDRLLLWLGVAALLTGLIFFVAANWYGMGRFGKFALAEIAVIISLVAYVFCARFRYGNAALLAASLAVGALLALIGQTYQTGANTFELFAIWALLIFPWVLIARLPALWALWLVILHVAYLFYVQTFGWLWGLSLEGENMLVGVVFMNCAALALWEWFARGREWMQGRWMPRLMALTAGFTVTALVIFFIVAYHDASGLYFLLYILFMAGMYGGYRRRIPDIFMLAGGAFSIIVAATTGLGRVIYETGSKEPISAFFMLGLFSMLATAGAAWWLRQVFREMKGGDADVKPAEMEAST